MALYTPEFLAAARHGYEDTDQPMTALAAELGIGITTLQTLVRKHGWTPRSQRMRDSPPALQLLGEAQALASQSAHSRDSGNPVLADDKHDGKDGLGPRLRGDERENASAAKQVTPTPTLPLAGGGSAPTPAPAPITTTPAPTAPSLTPVERLEALVVKELEAEEAMRAELALRPRTRHDAERCARTLSVLTQTLQTLLKMRTGGAGESNSVPYDDMPEDMDAFRHELARRIRIFVESRRKEKTDTEIAQENERAMEAKREEP